MSKPTIPKGTRDFLPHEVVRRDHIFSTIREVFRRYGYQGISTPVMESLSTLTGKYGDEGDQLLFKVLNNGDYLAKANPNALDARDSSAVTSSISKRGLRYDLTVPFARYVVMHQNDIQLPFKRYAIEPVWRADRPQKGRYQEFYQCDVDVVGSDSLMYEAELIQIYDEVFSTLDLNVEIKVNHRKVLAGIAEIAGIGNHFSTFAVAIDKLDKLPRDKVIEEMQRGGISESSATRALELISKGRSDLSDVLRTSEVGMEGLRELDSLHVYLDKINIQNKILFDATLARGLSYYTGCIFEVKSTDVNMGSIGGGGRYADLTGIFGLKGVSGVGISFGAERIYDVMEELNLFDSLQIGQITAIILAFDQDSHEHGFVLASKLRKLDIATDIYPEAAKFKKQMKYAGNGTYRYAILIGSEELSTQVYTVKELSSGDQQKCTLDQLIELLQSVS